MGTASPTNVVVILDSDFSAGAVNGVVIGQATRHGDKATASGIGQLQNHQMLPGVRSSAVALLGIDVPSNDIELELALQRVIELRKQGVPISTVSLSIGPSQYVKEIDAAIRELGTLGVMIVTYADGNLAYSIADEGYANVFGVGGLDSITNRADAAFVTAPHHSLKVTTGALHIQDRQPDDPHLSWGVPKVAIDIGLIFDEAIKQGKQFTFQEVMHLVELTARPLTNETGVPGAADINKALAVARYALDQGIPLTALTTEDVASITAISPAGDIAFDKVFAVTPDAVDVLDLDKARDLRFVSFEPNTEYVFVRTNTKTKLEEAVFVIDAQELHDRFDADTAEVRVSGIVSKHGVLILVDQTASALTTDTGVQFVRPVPAWLDLNPAVLSAFDAFANDTDKVVSERTPPVVGERKFVYDNHGDEVFVLKEKTASGQSIAYHIAPFTEQQREELRKSHRAPKLGENAFLNNIYRSQDAAANANKERGYILFESLNAKFSGVTAMPTYLGMILTPEGRPVFVTTFAEGFISLADNVDTGQLSDQEVQAVLLVSRYIDDIYSFVGHDVVEYHGGISQKKVVFLAPQGLTPKEDQLAQKYVRDVSPDSTDTKSEDVVKGDWQTTVFSNRLGDSKAIDIANSLERQPCRIGGCGDLAMKLIYLWSNPGTIRPPANTWGFSPTLAEFEKRNRELGRLVLQVANAKAVEAGLIAGGHGSMAIVVYYVKDNVWHAMNAINLHGKVHWIDVSNGNDGPPPDSEPGKAIRLILPEEKAPSAVVGPKDANDTELSKEELSLVLQEFIVDGAPPDEDEVVEGETILSPTRLKTLMSQYPGKNVIQLRGLG